MTELLYYSRDFIACIVAVCFFCIVMSIPKRAIPISSVFGSITYLLYRVVYLSGHEMLGYLFATMLAAIGAEILARKLKMPATVFVFPGIVPLVPGVGLHKALLCIVNNDIGGFATQGIKTLLISGIIAVTVAVVNALFRSANASKSNDQKPRFNSMRD